MWLWKGEKSSEPCGDVRARVCVCARTHQANRDHASPAAGFEILPRPSTKNPWSSDLKPLELFYAEMNFSIAEGVFGKGSACQPPCQHGLLMARGTSEVVGCQVEKWPRGCWWCDLSTGVKPKPTLSFLWRGWTLLHGSSPAGWAFPTQRGYQAQSTGSGTYGNHRCHTNAHSSCKYSKGETFCAHGGGRQETRRRVLPAPQVA